jgi:heme oxygenase
MDNSENDEKLQALAKKAKELQGDEFFKAVLVAMTSDATKRLLAIVPGTPEALSAHAELRAVGQISQQLQKIINAAVSIHGLR